jgi:hypothetical protein
MECGERIVDQSRAFKTPTRSSLPSKRLTKANEAMAALHTSTKGREWMAKLAKMSLKEYLAFRDAPFKDLD